MFNAYRLNSRRGDNSLVNPHFQVISDDDRSNFEQRPVKFGTGEQPFPGIIQVLPTFDQGTARLGDEQQDAIVALKRSDQNCFEGMQRL